MERWDKKQKKKEIGRKKKDGRKEGREEKGT